MAPRNDDSIRTPRALATGESKRDKEKAARRPTSHVADGARGIHDAFEASGRTSATAAGVHPLLQIAL
jgi:hypothetical protein